MNPIDFDFYNNLIIRRNQNCYTYALGSTWGFFPTRRGISPGMFRAKPGDNLPVNPHDLMARVIIDGAIPLEDPHRKNKTDFSLPAVPAGCHLVASFVAHYADAWIPHFVLVDGPVDNKTVKFSLRDGACVPGYDWAGDAWCDEMGIESFRDGHYNDMFSYRFVGFFARPAAGIDLSVQKVVHDIHESRPDALNGLGKGFVDLNLEFFDVTNRLHSLDLGDFSTADHALLEYCEAFGKYAKCWFGVNMEAINDRITAAYQKTPLAAADSERVHELFAKNLSARDIRIMKKNKVY